MTTVGILGGGQLARMLALSGAPLGLRFLVLDSTADACAAQFAPLLQADYRDEAGLAEFARRVDVATFDFENVPAESAHWLAGHWAAQRADGRWEYCCRQEGQFIPVGYCAGSDPAVAPGGDDGQLHH